MLLTLVVPCERVSVMMKQSSHAYKRGQKRPLQAAAFPECTDVDWAAERLAQAYEGKADIFADFGNMDKAIECIDHAIKLEREHPFEEYRGSWWKKIKWLPDEEAIKFIDEEIKAVNSMDPKRWYDDEDKKDTIQGLEREKNELLKRMANTRKNLSNDPHRPIYHYVNPENTLNDPNGLCFWQDRWHLFYQAYPPEDPRQHWGHTYSDDLIHWKDLPYAIYPHPEECCFSGATLVEENRVIAMYHGTQVGNMIAVSNDPLLLNWDKLTGEAVIPIPKDQKSEATQNSYTVFDPCIWEKDGYYYSLSAGTLPGTVKGDKVAADFLFRSEDLETWDYMHPFVENDSFTLAGDDGSSILQ